MIVRPTQSGKGLHLILTRAEAQRLLMLAARGTAMDQFGHQFRWTILKVLGRFGYDNEDFWRRVPGAIGEDGEAIT